MLRQSRKHQGQSPYLSNYEHMLEEAKHAQPTMTLKRNLELVCLIKDVGEVVIVELRTQKGVSVHCIENETVQTEAQENYAVRTARSERLKVQKLLICKSLGCLYKGISLRNTVNALQIAHLRIGNTSRTTHECLHLMTIEESLTSYSHPV